MSNSTVTFSDVFKDKFLSGFSLATQNLTLHTQDRKSVV